MGAGAFTITPENGNSFVSTAQSDWINNIDTNGVSIAGANVNSLLVPSALSVNNFYAGVPSDQGGAKNVYVLNNVYNPFTVAASADVSVASILQVLGGRQLSFQSGAATNTFNLTVGSNATNDGIKVGGYAGSNLESGVLTLNNVDNLIVNGSVIANGDLTVNANTASVGLINANSGSMNITTAQSMMMDGLVASSSGATNINGGTSITSTGTIQNIAGTMKLDAANNISVGGRLDNSGTSMQVSGGNLTVTGTMKNDSSASTTTLNLQNWTVNGGSASEYSVVNNGNFYATISGDTYLKYGLQLSDMDANNTFALDTGTLAFDTTANTSAWFSAFSNHLNNFSVVVRRGSIDLGTNGMLNGANNSSGANMLVAAQNIYANTVRNDGAQMQIIAGGSLTGDLPNITPGANTAQPATGQINISGDVIGAAQSETDIIASNSIDVTGAISNSGKMTINSTDVTVNSVSNSGINSTLTVSALTNTEGAVSVAGNITNANGTTTVWAKDVSITGTVINNSGTTQIRGSDTNNGDVIIGAINANGGMLNVNALAGSANITKGVTVTNGALNLGTSLNTLTVGESLQINGDFTASATSANGAGNMNVAISGNAFTMNADAVLIGGNISVTADDDARTIKFNAPLINITGDADVANKGYLVLGTNGSTYTNVEGTLTSNNSGVFETYGNDLYVGAMQGDAKFILHGQNLVADAGNIDIDGNIYFDASVDPANPESGLVIKDTTTMSIKTTNGGADINVGAVSVGNGNALIIQSADALNINGQFANKGDATVSAGGNVQITGDVTAGTDLNITGTNVNIGALSDVTTATINANNGNLTVGAVTSGGDLELSASGDINAATIAQTNGSMDITATALDTQSLSVQGTIGTQANVNANTVNVSGNTNIAGDLYQGGNSGMLNFDGDTWTAANLIVGGNFVAQSGNSKYNVGTNANITGDIVVDADAITAITTGNNLTASDVNNSGTLILGGGRGLDVQAIANNAGTLTIDSGTGIANINSWDIIAGNIILDGRGAYVDASTNTNAMLRQNYAGALDSKDINVVSEDYSLTTSNLLVSGISQTSGTMRINTSDVDVGGNIAATDLAFYANPSDNWMNVHVDGSVSGAVDFIGLEKMTITGDYVLDSNSRINAAILPYVSGTDINYWSSVTLTPDNTLGTITDAADGSALINVGGKFTSGTQYNEDAFSLSGTAAELANGQIGITLFDAVDQGTAIWLLHAEDGIENLTQLEQVRNLNVRYCNADGSLCYDYMESLADNNKSDDDLPAYVSVRDHNKDGVANDMYIVFDPQFGGPALLDNTKIQPIVEREPDHTDGEYVAAGALDDLLLGQAHHHKFYNRTPIEVIPIIFEGTNMQEMANELYDRMEYYLETSQGTGLARFSRLFQARELEQVAGTVALNEHTAFRSFEDRMFDEFIWNRKRQLKKAWADVDYGMLYQDITDGKHTDGNRFSIAGGFDWQESDTLVLGLTGRISHTTSSAFDKMDLGYMPNQVINGRVDIDVADTDIGLGAYLIKTLGEKARLYGNAFMDIHFFDITRSQNFVDTIDGDGTAFSMISEWGLMHDILNQYVVGNLYARAGYNFGFDITEEVHGTEFMNLESDAYFIFTPGYSLTAQKRIYPSAWFQIRPYASIGVEYDVIGAPDTVKYKFAPAYTFTDYHVNIDPLWANIGGGFEFVSATGIQVGIDYRYQYNQDIQLHNIKISGSYRF